MILVTTQRVGQAVVCHIDQNIKVGSTDRLFDDTFGFTGSKTRYRGRDDIGITTVTLESRVIFMLVLSVFAREIEFVDEISDSVKTNQIFLDGYICKEPVYRKTPLGREIADLLLAVNRPYGKSDYIPCICWGRNARYAEHFKVGERCAIWGRIQSREYMKKLDEENVEKRVAFEVSVSKLELVEEARESIV